MKTINIEFGTARGALVAWMCQDILVREAAAIALGQKREALKCKARLLIQADRTGDQVERGMRAQEAGQLALNGSQR